MMLALYLAMLETDAERESFARYYETYRDRAVAIARGILGSDSLAEDAAHNGWINLINKFPEFVQYSPQKQEGYLVSTMKHAAIDLIRKEGRLFSMEAADEPYTQTPISANSDYDALVEMIRQLPEAYRVPMEYSALGYTNREIAKALGISDSSVSRRLAKARELILERRKREGYD